MILVLGTMATLAMLAPWVWRGGTVWLLRASGLAFTIGLLAPSPLELALLAGIGASLLPVAWIDRRWPVDCVYCRFFRAAIATSAAVALVLVIGTIVRGGE